MSDQCCAICGSRKTADDKDPAVCQYLCGWILEGWLGWNARTKKVAIRDARAVSLVSTRLSYPKMIRMARWLGWTGQENVVGTFVQPTAKKAKA